VEVKSKAGGEIISFPFEEGDNLKKGEAAVILDPDTEQSRVNQANADLLMAEARLDKAKINLKDAYGGSQAGQGKDKPERRRASS
jgi:HlyD family secretion protein